MDARNATNQRSYRIENRHSTIINCPAASSGISKGFFKNAPRGRGIIPMEIKFMRI